MLAIAKSIRVLIGWRSDVLVLSYLKRLFSAFVFVMQNTITNYGQIRVLYHLCWELAKCIRVFNFYFFVWQYYRLQRHRSWGLIITRFFFTIKIRGLGIRYAMPTLANVYSCFLTCALYVSPRCVLKDRMDTCVLRGSTVPSVLPSLFL